jgi:hemerythrin superfamily protein
MGIRTITDLMIEDHCEIERLLDRFKSSIGHDFDTTGKIFEEFRQELKRHISIEEKAIFKFFNPTENEDYYNIVPDLIKEHDTLLEMLSGLKDNLVTGAKIDILDFKKLLTKHKNFEEKFFYPKLEKDLGEAQKNSIVENIKSNSPRLNY